MNLLLGFWELVVESAPWLLFGFLLAGIIKQLLPSAWVQQQLATPGLLSIVKGAVIGAPLPLCSCGVIPAALAVRKAGASKGATAAFLVATPETGVDSISFSYAVLGPVFAIARPVAALLSAIVAGVLVTGFDRESAPAPVAAASGCCGGTCTAPPAPQGFLQHLRDAVGYGFDTMIADTARWLVIGLAGAALVTAVVPQSFFLEWGDGVLAMLVMVLVGLPMYICATASTPLAASLLFAGVSPGAALVFMLTGPATNIATIGVVRAQLGNRALVAYLVGVIGSALVCGVVLDALFASYGWNLQLVLVEEGAATPLWRQLAAVVLVLLIARVWLKPLWRQRAGRGQAVTGDV